MDKSKALQVVTITENYEIISSRPVFTNKYTKGILRYFKENN